MYLTEWYTGTDDLFAALEDNQVTLATMKASRFVKVFAKQVDKWERALSLILEVIEMTLTVQRQWMYVYISDCLSIFSFLFVHLFSLSYLSFSLLDTGFRHRGRCCSEELHPRYATDAYWFGLVWPFGL